MASSDYILTCTMRVLIVEDDPAIVRFLERGLAAHGHRAISADNGEDGDRKSTRLNSSHANISYAVFCLKKKTKHRLTSRSLQPRATPTPPRRRRAQLQPPRRRCVGPGGRR